MKNIRYTFVFVLFLVSFFGCKEYLDLVPEDDIKTVETIFERQSTAEQFYITIFEAAGGLEGSFRNDPAALGADEFATNGYARTKKRPDQDPTFFPAFLLSTGEQQTLNPWFSLWGKRSHGSITMFTNMYWNIRNANIFITHIDDVYDMSDEDKIQWKAEIKGMKAYFYFKLMQMYGPIVLIDENISVEEDVETMQVPRSHVDTCFNEIVRLCDEAIPHLVNSTMQPDSRKQTFNKEFVMGIKAKALLYAASPLFNGNDWFANFKNRNGEPLFSTTYDEKKWERAAKAIDEAVNECEHNGIFLTKGYSLKNSKMLNTIRDIQHSVLPVGFKGDEVIYSRGIGGASPPLSKYPTFSSKHFMYNPAITGNVNPTMRMVEAFYTANGLPIDMDKTWDFANRYKMGKETNTAYTKVIDVNDDVLNLHLRREARFYANIGFDGGYWELGSNNYIKMDPYRNGQNGTTKDRMDPLSPQNITGYWAKKILSPDERPVSAYLSNPAPFSYLRLPDLYLMQAEAWNEFSGPSEKVYNAINKVRERAGIPTVENAWLKYSKQPGKYKTKDGLRDIIRQERTIEFAFESSRFWDMRRWKTAHLEMNKPIKGWNVFGDNSKSFYNNYDGPIDVWTSNKFEAPRDYFFPISSKEVMVGNIVQNLGW